MPVGENPVIEKMLIKFLGHLTIVPFPIRNPMFTMTNKILCLVIVNYDYHRDILSSMTSLSRIVR